MKNKNLSYLLLVSFVFIFSANSAFATSKEVVSKKVTPKIEDTTEVSRSSSETSMEVEPKSPAPRSQAALQHMSEVAKYVEKLLNSKTLKGGIGDQVREVARIQKESASKIKPELNALDSRSEMLKAVFGPDYQAIKNIEIIIKENKLNISKLEALLPKITLKSDVDLLKSSLEALKFQNESFQARVNQELRIDSIFGWIFKSLTK